MINEPVIAVGLVENAESVALQLLDEYTDDRGRRFLPGEYRFDVIDGSVNCSTVKYSYDAGCCLKGSSASSRFQVDVIIGIDFHWQQKKRHTFCGSLRLLYCQDNSITVINDVPLESYILSVCCSEMRAQSPDEFLKAHSIISRSWLLAQLASKDTAVAPPEPDPNTNDILRWYDRQSHTEFDVCADDHCQRYQGIDMITSGRVASAVESTRGEVLMFDGAACDARFSKCCGGITEDFRLAWSETPYPYLIPLPDAPDSRMPAPPLSNEKAAREFIMGAPDAYCNCRDPEILGAVLNNYDQSTQDFFRWRVRITPDEIAALLKKKLSLDLGRIVALEPVERGLSGRLKRLRIVGEKRTVVIGKELEIRRALSTTHLYSSAFVIDTEGAADRPDAFVLSGAGWGHGVGLCQIGAAVMAYRGVGYQEILRHYYPGSILERIYV